MLDFQNRKNGHLTCGQAVSHISDLSSESILKQV